MRLVITVVFALALTMLASMSELLPAQGDHGEFVVAGSAAVIPGTNGTIDVVIHNVDPGLFSWIIDINYSNPALSNPVCAINPNPGLSNEDCDPAFLPTTVRLRSNPNAIQIITGDVLIGRITFTLSSLDALCDANNIVSVSIVQIVDSDISDVTVDYAGQNGQICPLAVPTNTPPATSTNTPAGPTLTPTPTITPGGPTLTPTSTVTPVGPTLTPTPTITPGGPTLTPTPTVTPGGPTFTPTPSVTPGSPVPTATSTAVGPIPTPTRTPLVILPGFPSIPAFVQTVVNIGGGSADGESVFNTANIETDPQRGSDDDFRIDVRVLDRVGTPLPNVRVLFLVDNGVVTAEGVVEPGLTRAGDDCDDDDDLDSSSVNIANVDPLSPRLSATVTSNDQGIASACVYANSELIGEVDEALPGKINVTTIVQVVGGTPLVNTATVQVVGPAETLKLNVVPTRGLRCGEKATVIATLNDAAGQNVSEHTPVEMVTNFRGVLGGASAVPLQTALAPFFPSGVIAETFRGEATAYLLTNSGHVGPYVVVATVDGEITDSVSITCTPAAGAATGSEGGLEATTLSTSSPLSRTEALFVTPPRTGDAGLVSDAGF